MYSFRLFRLVPVRLENTCLRTFRLIKIIFIKNSTYQLEFTNFAALKELQYAYSK